MKNLIFLFLAGFLAVSTAVFAVSDSVYSETWDISSLEEIGGHPVTIFGDPAVVSTEIGDAVEFDGYEDQLLVDFNPLMDATEFTVELVFWPAASFPAITEPRFVHIQDPEDPDAKRVMMELRIRGDNQCYLDGFMKTDLENLTLIDEALVHPTETWHHAAITYTDSTFTTYFDGVKELSGTCRYSTAIVNPTGKTSLGARMNQVAHFSGRMKTLKITHRSLEPSEFISIPDTTGTFIPADAAGSAGTIRLFPNPADRMLHLQCSTRAALSGGVVRIHDLSGKTIHEQELIGGTENHRTLDTSDLLEGIYILSFLSGNLTEYKKFVVLH